MRIYISADIEGVAGVVSRDQTGPASFEYAEAREWMTGEVNAACEAAFGNGASEVVVSDSHGNGQNLLPDVLDERVELVRSWPRPLGMMQGIEHGEYAAAVLIGYHAGSTNLGGVLAHTHSSKAFREIRINGDTFSEALISAATASHFSVPVIFASGDDAFAREFNNAIPDVETVITKCAYGTLSARTLLPAESRRRIRQGVTDAIQRHDEFSCLKVALPISLSVSFKHRLPAEVLEYLPSVTRSDAFTVEMDVSDMTEVTRVLSFMTQYNPALF